MEGEEWRPVVGWGEFYEVSNLGRVRSLDRVFLCKDGRHRGRQGRILSLKARAKQGGYPLVSLHAGGYTRTAKVHLLVAYAFLGPRPSGLRVRHRDGNPLNNKVDNLCYGTQSQNIKDSVAHGTHNHARKARCKRGHLLKFPNLVPGQWLNYNRRCCLVCSQAWGFQKRHPEIDLQIESDRRYAEIKHLLEV